MISYSIRTTANVLGSENQWCFVCCSYVSLFNAPCPFLGDLRGIFECYEDLQDFYYFIGLYSESDNLKECHIA